MEDYKEMYHLLFNKITDIIAELQDAQKKAEELFISREETDSNGDKKDGCLYMRGSHDRDTR